MKSLQKAETRKFHVEHIRAAEISETGPMIEDINLAKKGRRLLGQLGSGNPNLDAR